jgi:THO complex subunit 4
LQSTDIRLLQDYFGQTIGQVKKVLLTYGPSGRSRGVATIIFRGGDMGQKAVKQLDGVKVDNKPMRVCSTIKCLQHALY